MRKKSESPDALDQFLADTREYGPPKIIRTDDAPQLKAGKFDEICRKLHIKRKNYFREYTAAERSSSTWSNAYRESSEGVCLPGESVVCRHGPPTDEPPVDRQSPQRVRCSQPFGNQIEQRNDHP